MLNAGGGNGICAFDKIIRYDKSDNDTYKTTLKLFSGTVPNSYSGDNVFIPNERQNTFDDGIFDLDKGIFIPSAEYAQYGASIN